jgi:DNA-directed RNA polymerase specialized sigma24 family protein
MIVSDHAQVDAGQRKFYALDRTRYSSWTTQIMVEPSVKQEEPKKAWSLTARTFDRLLNWLNEGENSADAKYLEMHRRLIAYFDRKNCRAPDELTDETLNRVARRLEEEGAIVTETPAKYCYIVARFVFMEHLREADKRTDALDEIRRQKSGRDAAAAEVNDRKETLLNCLDRCTSKLPSANRELITRYYIGKERVKIENRRALAQSLGITINALSIRACRIRDKLEACVRQCAAME